MDPALAIPELPCPGCGAVLAAEGEERSCPECGRAFTRILHEGAQALIYRAAKVADLVPFEKPPPFLGLVDESEGTALLDVRIGGTSLAGPPAKMTWQIFRLLAAVATVGLFIADVLSRGQLHLWWVWMTLLVPCFAAGWATDRPNDRLTLENDHLRWTRYRFPYFWWARRSAHEERTAPLDRITGVHDTGASIRVVLDDGTAWNIGEGLNVPEPVRRWVAQRAAHLLPPRSQDE